MNGMTADEGNGPADAEPRICVSLSGGGYRAAAFGHGAVLALIDLGLAEQIMAVSSVSGGSITNAFAATALLTEDEGKDETGHWERSSRLLSLLSHRDLVSVRGYLLVVGLACLELLLVAAAATGVFGATPSGLLLVLAVLLVLTTCAMWGYLSLRSRAGGLLHLHLLHRDPEPIKIREMVPAILRLALYACTLQLGKHHRLAGHLFSESTWALTLSDLRASYRPVFCSTDLGRGTHVYLSDRFVAGVSPAHPRGPRGGDVDLVGAAPALPLASAVMASAAFPGVFQPLTVRMSDLGLKESRGSAPVRLGDGGLHDNLGFTFPKAWYEGRLSAALAGDMGRRPNVFLVVDSGFFPLEDIRWQDPVRAFKRSVAVVHQANSSARREQVETFLHRDDIRGAIIHIGEDPYEIADRQSPSDRAALLRAFDRLAGDDRRISQSWWHSVAQDLNTAVRTELKGLGPETTARLVFHGYVNTLAHVAPMLGCALPIESPSLRDLEQQCAIRTPKRPRRHVAFPAAAEPPDEATAAAAA